jgi:putative transposase
MKGVRFTEEQIIAVLREHEAGAKTADLARAQPTASFSNSHCLITHQLQTEAPNRTSLFRAP